MARLFRTLAALAAAGALAGGAGFAGFADTVRGLSPDPAAKADAIVVLTGDEERIATGVRLIVAGRAKRLLISGVHAATRVPTELKRLNRAGDGSEAVVKCCVDIGRDALNTSGNAEEARQWAETHGFRRLIVVTSSYHMPRSLVEFQRAMPDIDLIAYPAISGRHLQLDNWWQHAPTARLLLSEYVKFLGAAARFGIYRTISPLPASPEGAPPPASVSVRAGP